jgi:hypothetical protein
MTSQIKIPLHQLDQAMVNDIQEKYPNSEVVKYGISDKAISKDGQSSRMKKQVNYLNRAVGWLRYFAVVIISGIKGRVAAKEKEEEYIENYTAENERRPRGNV